MVRNKRNLGPSFPDEVVRVSSKKGLFKRVESDDWKDTLLPNFDLNLSENLSKSPWRVVVFSIVCLLLFFIIFLRLFHLQIVEGRTNRDFADGNRIQIKVIHAPRGVIFDRNGKVLAANSPAFRFFDPSTKKVRFVSREEALELEVKNDPRSVNLEVDNVRTYPMGERFAHVIGYVGEISSTQLGDFEYKSYHLGDRIGQIGIEAQYEAKLRGIDGGKIVEVDTFGREIRSLRQNPPISGQNIYLTIDSDLQDKIYGHLKETLSKSGSCCGAVVAMDPTNGQVLALVSLPSFDPNIFTHSYDEGAISQIFSQSQAPILNRAISGTYPPGSTFKIVSSLAALTSGKVTAQTTIVDNGVIYLGSFKFTNWYFTQYGKLEGSVNLSKALQRSNDTYFYEISRMIGMEKLIAWAKKLKLGGKLDIDLPGEASGLVPSDEWKRKTFGQIWFPGDTLHLAIGQGFILTTPLQILGITAFIASDGVLYQPQLVLSNFKPKILVSNLTSQDNIKLIKNGLKLVTQTGGTAWPFFTFPIPTGGKTGTAEFGDRTHAWYTSFAPFNDPKIALTVIVEAGGEGSSVSAPIAKEAYRWFFSPEKSKLIQDVSTQATDSGRPI